MRITRIALTAILALGFATAGQPAANAEAPVSAPTDFWFICC